MLTETFLCADTPKFFGRISETPFVQINLLTFLYDIDNYLVTDVIGLE